MGIGDKIRQLRKDLGLTLEDVGRAVGVGKSTVRKWETGDIKDMRRDKISSLAAVLQIDPVELMGFSDMTPATRSARPKKIPILGTIAAGVPLLAEQNIEDYLTVPVEWRIDFALRVKGSSMIDAGILDQSIVLCQSCPDVDDGEIAVCMVDNEEATLKRVKRYPNVLVLHPENPAYTDIVFEGRHRSAVKIIGKARKVIHEVK